MKRLLFFPILFLLPCFLFAHHMHEEDCKEYYQQSIDYWNKTQKIIEQINQLRPEQTEERIRLLNEAIANCQSALGYCQKILDGIASVSPKDQKKPWRVNMKDFCENNKKVFSESLTGLKNALNKILNTKKAQELYVQSLQKEQNANTKLQNCQRGLNNVEEVVSILKEVSTLYDEALSLMAQALNLIAPYHDETSAAILNQAIKNYTEKRDQYKKDAETWASVVLAQKDDLKKKFFALKEDAKIFQEKGLQRSSYETQKQMIPILEKLLECNLGDKAELLQLKNAVAAFEEEAERNRLTEPPPLLSQEEFLGREKERRDLFFTNDLILQPKLFNQNNQQFTTLPCAFPLDGQIAKNDKSFTLCAEQFYRFLIKSDKPLSEVVVKVFEGEKFLCEETIVLPQQGTPSWNNYLLRDGMVFVPETKIKDKFGLNLRFSFVYEPSCSVSVITSEKCSNSNYRFAFYSKNQELLYECNFIDPPPWQLDLLRKPAFPKIDQPLEKKDFVFSTNLPGELGKKLEESFPILDKFVEELKNDPLAIAEYVYNEIALPNSFSYQEEGVFQAPAIQRNACLTFLEKEGSPWEQCQLLVYLLRKAGYSALYVTGSKCSLSKDFIEKLLFTELAEGKSEGLLQYPWVLFFNGKEWISLFPWMKEMQVKEGYDLYNYMPEEYSSADKWILRYLKCDEKILKHIGPDGDDTLGVLFVRFVAEELRKQGLALSDIGLQRTPIKKQFSSWSDFPRPTIVGESLSFESLKQQPYLFAQAQIEIFPHENPQKKISKNFSLTDLNLRTIDLSFPSSKELRVQFIGEATERRIILDESNETIEIKVTYDNYIGSIGEKLVKSIFMAKDTEAALCFNIGKASAAVTQQFYNNFSSEQAETKRLHALLAFVGATYFEKCSRAQEILAKLHKVPTAFDFSFGLAKLSPANHLKEEVKSKLPQVDMLSIRASIPSFLNSTVWQQKFYSAFRQYETLRLVDGSSNEHQILRDIFEDPYAISTVKLLQLANIEQQKNGLVEPGFLTLTSSIIEEVEKSPETAKTLFFPQLQNLNLRDINTISCGEWNAAQNILSQKDNFDPLAYAYMTPGPLLSQDGSYQEMGTFIFNFDQQWAFISNNNLLFNGGLGSPLPDYYFAPFAISNWQLVPTYSGIFTGYSLQVPSPSDIQVPPSPTESTVVIPDVRLEHKSIFSGVCDPVDIVTGSFYVDEIDLFLPGPFPLEIRRNYNSQNPLVGDFGCGWKLSLNPYLVKQEDKLYATEADGTTIAYSYNSKNSRWEILPENNPDLCNFNQKGIGSTFNPFHAYIENDILYGADGSKRFFENGLLKKWINNAGNTLTFSYNDDRLSRIESSNGSFCGFKYNPEGKISEIYVKDGRRIYYSYNYQGDLTQVTLPNTATIIYEYDKLHRIIRETKSEGQVLENIYDEQGRIKEQRSPMGPQQQIITSATFEYQDGITTVTDAAGGKTIYKIFQKKIYKITDPLGYQTLFSWFIDDKSWFDPETERIAEWTLHGGAIRSLKSSTDKRGLTTYYLYDSRGNPQEIGLQGKDLTGDGLSLVTKKLTYNEQNLCILEEVLGQKTITTYHPKFSYLPKRIEKYSNDALLSYVDIDYNSLGQIEREDLSGSITLWKYDNRGFPCQKTQITGTDDPDVTTSYSYNNQGECIKVTTADGLEENEYDIMGNKIHSKVFSNSGTLLSATHIGYNLNNRPIWRQTANPNNVIYFYYNASGALKASRQNLAPGKGVAYTLYEYDSRGYLTQEVDPYGYTTYMNYDALGRVVSKAKEGATLFFTYEPGGLVETVTSPTGAKTKNLYTTNGLLKEVLYPDGTKNTRICDIFGRPVLETKNDLTWKIEYDDSNHRVIRTHTKTKISETSKFDARGNLVSFTDAAGFVHTRTYDGLNRLKTETSPTGEKTLWNYQGDTVIATLPNGEKRLQRHEGGRLSSVKTFDAKDTLIASSSYDFDPVNDLQKSIQGDEVTTTWLNALGQPIKVQKGEITTTYEYDLCGNCTTVIDGDGKVVRQTFDGLKRMVQKELPSGGIINYAYDANSNLTAYNLPNGTTWTASYDSMGRKVFEELQSEQASSQHWEYIYENGYLTAMKDPMQRLHAYTYDAHGRLSQETVDGWSRLYTYEPRGLLSSAEQISLQSSFCPEHSEIERSYDADGRLILENIYLNSELLQQTSQSWEPSKRSLQINDHTRDFIYQNNHLIKVATKDIELSYSYNLAGSLKSQSSPFTHSTFTYNQAGLPTNIQTVTPNSSYEERLNWYPSGKLSSYASPRQQKDFSYTTAGYLQSTGSEKYDFDFGKIGTGVRTLAPSSYVPQDGLDPFGKIFTEIANNKSLLTTYNPMGEVIAQNKREFTWDPWGRLLRVSDSDLSWETSYDALGRRLQTRYKPDATHTITSVSLYDPEKEFQEIGVKSGDKTFWKIYGPASCDALLDESGASLVLLHNALGQLEGTVSPESTSYTKKFPSAYGPQALAPSALDLNSFAESLTWHSQRQDPTGLIWMGKRYYDPKGGRFLSPDPISYPICLDLYAYAGGDPVNYIDPDGRFCSSVYQKVAPTVIDAWNNPRFQGTLQAVSGFAEVSVGCALASTPFAPLGAVLVAHGADHMIAGGRTAIYGTPCTTMTSQLLQKTGMSPEMATTWDNAANLAATLGGSGLLYNASKKVALLNDSLSMPTFQNKNNFTMLYRVVKPEELADIQKTCAFRNLGDAEGKYFTTSMEGASSYAKQAVKGFGDPPYTLIKTRVPNSIFDGINPVFVDRGIPAWVIPDQKLEGLVPEIVPWMLVPK